MSYSPRDAWLIPLLKRMSKRPGMFLGNERVGTLATYLQGYGQARVDLGVPEFGEGEETLLVDFEKWLAAEMGDTRDVAWPTLIATADPGDHNVRTFFHRLEEFLQQRGQCLSRLVEKEQSPEGDSKP